MLYFPNFSSHIRYKIATVHGTEIKKSKKGNNSQNRNKSKWKLKSVNFKKCKSNNCRSNSFNDKTKETSVKIVNRKSSSNNSSNRLSCSSERSQSKPHYSSTDAHHYYLEIIKGQKCSPLYDFLTQKHCTQCRFNNHHEFNRDKKLSMVYMYRLTILSIRRSLLITPLVPKSFSLTWNPSFLCGAIIVHPGPRLLVNWPPPPHSLFPPPTVSQSNYAPFHDDITIPTSLSSAQIHPHDCRLPWGNKPSS